MNILKVIAAGCLISLQVACGSDSVNSAGDKQGAIPEHQLQALDKADNIENTLLESEQKRKKEMDDQGL